MLKHRHLDTLTYRFPRTLNDAFGLDATSAYAITHYTSRRYMLIKWLLRAFTLGWVALMVIGIATL